MKNKDKDIKKECKKCSNKEILDKKVETSKKGNEYYKEIESKKED